MRGYCEHNAPKKYIDGYPPNEAKIESTVAGFEALGFPQCYGAIDGCHIEVNVPKADATDYFSYKGWHSIVLFAAADFNCAFTYINIGSPGRNNDSYIFENSALKKIHNTNTVFRNKSRVIENVNVPVLLLGDSAFRLSPLLMKPYPVANTANEKNFNYRLWKCRRVIENAFGRYKCRFRKIGRGLEVHIDNAPTIISACCILHNFCIRSNDPVYHHWTEESAAFERRQQPTFTTNIVEDTANATTIRNALARYFGTMDLGVDVEQPGSH